MTQTILDNERFLKRASVQHFDLTDIENAIGLNSIKSTVADTQQLIANSSAASAKIAPLIDFVSNHYIEILISYAILLILTDVIANLITNSK